jgi:hypothetical protein
MMNGRFVIAFPGRMENKIKGTSSLSVHQPRSDNICPVLQGF